MACGGCKNRRELLTRMFTKLVPRSSAPKPVVSSGAGGVTMTTKGYVAKCKYCLQDGEPSPTPEKAVTTCGCEEKQD